MGLSRLYLLLCLTSILVSCRSDAAFPYRYYAIRASSYAGMLLGNAPENDIPFSRCAPAQGNEAPCLLMLKDDYLRLKADYLNLQETVICYQQGRCRN